MKYSELKDMTVDELKKNNRKLRQELFETRMKHAMGQVSNPIKIRELRRTVARVKTALTAKLR